jgi:mannose-6-phosphate isomerase-like protein (cupin superfamily)
VRHFKLDEVSGVTINQQINERRIKLLASPVSEIRRQNFSVGVSIVAPGKVHEEHQHDASEELIVVIGGEGQAKIAGQEFAIGYGSVIDIGKGESHGFVNPSQSPLVLLWIYDPPGAEKKFVSERAKEGMA